MPCWMSLFMSDEQNKESLLVDQKDALGFYFDSLLMPDENDLADKSVSENTALKNRPDLQEQNDSEHFSVQQTDEIQDKLHSNDVVDKLQAAKDFLQASQRRQGKQNTQFDKQVVQSAQVQQTAQNLNIKINHVADSKLVSEKSNTSIESRPTDISSKTITKGPVSPKPRLKESKHNNKLLPSSSKIVFSTKNDDGKVIEQVLIPRSQRLAADKSNGTQSIAKAGSKTDTSELKNERGAEIQSENKSGSPIASANDKASFNSHLSAEQLSTEPENESKNESATENKPLTPVEPAIEIAPLENKKTSAKKITADSQEAPILDLSLFLPKIKTLSDEEISQQIEALTQAAVSQAQLESDLAHVAELEQVSQKLLRTQSESVLDESVRNVDNAPAWAVPDFQALLFTVAGLKLAVPLIELNGIIEWGDEYITELPGHKSWYLGIIQNQGKSVPVIDTLQQVVPQNRWPENYLADRKFKHIILIDNARWGLACETVLEVVTLKTDSVKWRSSRTRRRWLLGTVIEHMCALLDSSEFAAMLKTGDDSLLS